ncbi:pilus assembly protein [Vibrio sp. SCSIO 43140]|uniref:TadE/TadG family type IV pilus assembly protein n=1 Tax=Vibrio sp. SCSIO 43140 TaxID=2819100 RepID=UPI0020765310|nr:TadE family protein [Vibrio sp. SCSIO 43140]USD61775.1 pilus assembly protein [Vibrio sp. SCSIO 43140]
MKNSNVKQKGLAALEFLWISPLVILFMAMCAELGNVFVDYQLLNKHVRSAARYAVSEVVGTAGSVDAVYEIEPEIKNVAVFANPLGAGSPVLSGLSVSDVSVSIDSSLITITAVYTYQPIFEVLPFTEISTQFDLTASSVMLGRFATTE